MIDSFNQSYLHVLSWEGGYTDNPLDPGGATNLGITQRTLAQWKGRKVTKAEVMDLSGDKRIYKSFYWDAIRGDALPRGIDLALFDAAVNHGPKRAAKFMQKALGVKVDGIIGPVTMKAVLERKLYFGVGNRDLLQKIHVNRALSYTSLFTFKTFGRGWMARLFDTHDKAVALTRDSG